MAIFPRLTEKNFLIPITFFLLTLFLDNLATASGTDYFTMPQREGNPVVVWLWAVFGDARILLPFLWVMLVILVSYFLYRKVKRAIGLWLLYTIGVGHLIGFLSWTPLNFIGRYGGENRLGALFFLILLFGALGFLLAKLHIRFFQRSNVIT